MRSRKQCVKKSLPEDVSSTKHAKGIQDAPDDEKVDEILKNGRVNNEVVERSKSENVTIANEWQICGVGLVGILKVLAVVILVPPFLNYASLQKESRSLRPAGNLQTLPRGHRLFMNCSGKGLPVVMMDNPGGFSSDVWSLIQPQVAKFTKVCIYDRAGLGFSENLFSRAQSGKWNDSNDNVHKQMHPTTENMVDDLHYLLKIILNDSSSVILAGGGLGAVNMRFYARLYENIFGLVLINSFYEDMFSQENNEWGKFWYEHFIPSLQIHRVLATLGITRLGLLTGFIKPNTMVDTRLDDVVKTRLKYLLCNSEHLTSGISEQFYINESLTQLKILRKVKPFPRNVSVEIISSEKFSSHLTSTLNNFWYKNQELLVNEVFPFSKRQFVDADFHTVYIDSAAVIIKTIRKLVQKFRKSMKQTANI